METKSDTATSGDGGTPPLEAAEEAFQKIRAEMATLDAGDLVRINVDIPKAVTIALGAFERMRPLRPMIVDKLPQHAVKSLDNLPTYALAALYAHVIGVPPESNGAARKLLEEAAKLRDDLLTAAEALVQRGRLDANRVSEIRRGLGNIDRGSDLIALAALFTEVWADLEHRTDIQWAEVERAQELGPELLQALGARRFASPGGRSPQARDDRARAFTLLVKAYDDCRQAVGYLRWKEGDEDTFAPSLRPKPRSAPPAPAPAPTPTPAGAGGSSEPSPTSTQPPTPKRTTDTPRAA